MLTEQEVALEVARIREANQDLPATIGSINIMLEQAIVKGYELGKLKPRASMTFRKKQ